jgi:hypothetical protein
LHIEECYSDEQGSGNISKIKKALLGMENGERR